MPIYSADFETRAGSKAEEERLTYVWAWAICSIDEIHNVDVGNTMNSFIEYISALPNKSIIYFHNLKFDGKFLIDWLLRNGFMLHKKARTKQSFDCLIDESGSFYNINIRFTKTQKIEIRDSFKKLTSSVEDLGESFKTEFRKLWIDYIEERPQGYELTQQEIEYVKNDVRVVAECLAYLYSEGMDHMTASSDCLADFKNVFAKGKENEERIFRMFFPKLDEYEDGFVRNSYRGGWCYCSRPGVYEGCGNTYDVNSLYPSMMHSMSGNKYPYCTGRYFKGEYKEDKDFPLYVQHFWARFEILPNHLPTLQIKNRKQDWKTNEWVKSSKGDMVELYMTNIDLELFFNHYEVIEIYFVDGYKYRAAEGLFDDYIDKWAEVKKTSKGAKRSLAKLMLNGLYGKFGQRLKLAEKKPELIDDDVKYITQETEERDGVYIPVAAFVTSYARRFTITAAQENYNSFIYADTDSIHMIGEAKGIPIHDKNLCAWKHESEWEYGIFRRQKTYIEIEKGATALNADYVKCAGMPAEAKQKFCHQVAEGKLQITDFDVGLCIEGAKLAPETVKGGVILVATDYTMHDVPALRF